ncbi:NAD(P)H-binding protein [Pseudonocardia sp. DSM 110487]|uniref:NAD(P)-dependent oxidoreductase n=1 Tax=Pseudonocardia sp. DSM 110487 TaxID=2865833 RepID=UPI001C6A3DCF|nr:NAD(P)H-binding protein [Pseudonocardia sp. DSM 110487]QYN32065.1 NAD(P)H-binding protein [Pseudonocardia sp. DSM 110487]
MQITVIGAAGFVGSRVVTEAVARGHDVTAVVRDRSRAAVLPAGVRVRSGDAADIADVAMLGDGQDAVVAATRPPAGRESELVATTKALLAGLAGTGARLVVVGGAGSLAVPGSGGRLVAEDPDLVEPDYRGIARAGVRQLAACRAAVDVDWTYVSPPAAMLPGARTGRYRLGGDELLVDAAGRSAISVEDMAVALVDEIEAPAHRRVRFTVAY